MSNWAQWGLSVLVIVGVAAWAHWWRAREARRSARQLSRTPCTPIDEAAEGMVVKVVGRVSFGEQKLAAPLTGNPCVCYSLRVVDVASENGGVLVDVHEGVPFLLSDSTATIAVTPLYFRLVPSDESVRAWRTQEGGPCQRLLESYLENTGAAGNHGALQMLRRHAPLAANEAHLREGMTIAAQGVVERAPDGTGQPSLRLICSDDSPMLLSDDARTFG